MLDACTHHAGDGLVELLSRFSSQRPSFQGLLLTHSLSNLVFHHPVK